MKLKYYLRGLGIGILVTTVILSLAGVGRKNMTDEEVVKRAKELGMVESTLLSDLPDQTKTDEVRPTEPEISLQPETCSKSIMNGAPKAIQYFPAMACKMVHYTPGQNDTFNNVP